MLFIKKQKQTTKNSQHTTLCSAFIDYNNSVNTRNEYVWYETMMSGRTLKEALALFCKCFLIHAIMPQITSSESLLVVSKVSAKLAVRAELAKMKFVECKRRNICRILKLPGLLQTLFLYDKWMCVPDVSRLFLIEI